MGIGGQSLYKTKLMLLAPAKHFSLFMKPVLAVVAICYALADNGGELSLYPIEKTNRGVGFVQLIARCKSVD